MGKIHKIHPERQIVVTVLKNKPSVKILEPELGQFTKFSKNFQNLLIFFYQYNEQFCTFRRIFSVKILHFLQYFYNFNTRGLHDSLHFFLKTVG